MIAPIIIIKAICPPEKRNEYKEFYKEFKNVSIDALKKMMFLNKENGEEDYYN